MSSTTWGDMTVVELEKVLRVLDSMYKMNVPVDSPHQPTDMASFNWKLGRASIAEDVRRTISAKKNRQ